LDLIHATDSDNSKLKKTVFEGMRPLWFMLAMFQLLYAH
jgi:hypothetical protein